MTRVPSPPADLGDAGKAEWVRILGDAGPRGRNILTAAHVSIVHDLCRTVDDAERFRATWLAEGATVDSRGRPFPHPAIASEREARKAVNQLRRELGATPASAARVPPAPEPPDPDIDDRLNFLIGE